ncbi:MAG: HAD family hydrolase [Spirochaetales bacterium]|jgi:bifunctional ADP-heptose synthase (sugar kinase/adenylyltransferase)/phosphoglycolate phosphatase-like HAD superfamily hydrolase|nr:HAD family hydrolase [Spirochaetales bacterium]
MTEQRIQDLLKNIKTVKAGVYGDFCLDAYWILDPSGSEESVETGVQAEAVERHYYSPGGASNVTANMAALFPERIQAIGSIGDDIYGRELRRLLTEIDVDSSCLVIQEGQFDTLAFCKSYVDLHEKLRVDFGTGNARTTETEDKLLIGLGKALDECDIVIFNQQVPGTLANLGFITGANKLFEKYSGTTVILDSRHYGGQFQGVGRKVNEVEAALLCGADAKPRDIMDKDAVIGFGQQLFDRSGRPVFITRGAKGILSFDVDGCTEIPGIQTDGELDTVGAGDTTLSMIALSLGAGASAAEAAGLANIAASVTVQKLRRTGTANGDEILNLYRDVRYIHQPELAAHTGSAKYLAGGNIEICAAPEKGAVKYALFDHDGTISTLRAGWEEVMVPMMTNAILGSKSHPESTVERVRNEVISYIDSSTGIQTILQMETLCRMVEEAGLAPKDEILTSLEYKAIYNNGLMAKVGERMEAVRRGEKHPQDFVIAGALDFLKVLNNRGITIYLASGTDQDDVHREAEYLGYKEFFNGGIYGAVGDISQYSKKKLLREIIEENKLEKGELLVIGDGPVEIQECRRQNGTAIGIASNEETGVGVNSQKRTRLIRAGAHFIVPDLTGAGEILDFLLTRD